MNISQKKTIHVNYYNYMYIPHIYMYTYTTSPRSWCHTNFIICLYTNVYSWSYINECIFITSFQILRLRFSRRAPAYRFKTYKFPLYLQFTFQNIIKSFATTYDLYEVTCDCSLCVVLFEDHCVDPVDRAALLLFM